MPPAPDPETPLALGGWIDEIHQGVRYGLAGRVIAEAQSPFQRVTIIESERYGKGLLLDGCWMTAEHRERHYHEPLVHPALCGAAAIERVLVIGGGDGGDTVRLLREVFAQADPLYGWVPMYPSGWWSWTFAAPDGPRYRKPRPERAAAVADGCHIWSPPWQEGAFIAMPAFIARELTTP